jgi:mannobiose 2-epimerase
MHLLLSLILVAQTAPSPGSRVPPTRDEVRAQAKRCERLLKTSLVDFYLPACVDHDNGGYFEVLKDGKFAPSGEKFLVMQARQLWFFSTLASEGIEKEAALSAARIGFDFLESKMRDREHGGYFAKVTDEGRPKDTRKHVYLNAFALYGLVAHHRATGDPASLEAAKDLFRTLEARAYDRDHGGYNEFFTADWKVIDDPKAPGYVGAIGVKTYNTHLHVLEAFAALYRAWPDPLVRRRLDELIVINMRTVRHPEVSCNIDAWHPDWRIVDEPSNLRASYGHDIECAWLVLDAAEALGMPASLFRGWAEGLCDNSLKYGFDREHGGFFYTGPPGRPAADTKKEWWVQSEALPSMLRLYRLTRDRSYYDAFVHTLDFIEAHHLAPGGGWYATRKADGSPFDNHLSSPWQGAYHGGRALILSRRWLEEIR